MSTKKKYRKSKKSDLAQMLTNRLREIEIQLEGLPPSVRDQLQHRVNAEIVKASLELNAEIAALSKESERRLREHIAQIITPQSIGEAFASIPRKSPTEVRSYPDAERISTPADVTLG